MNFPFERDLVTKSGVRWGLDVADRRRFAMDQFAQNTWAAGLDRIPKSQYEAAAVDGANAWQTFRAITWPGLQPTLGLTGLLSLINSFKVFREAYLVAGSYPHESMYLLQHLFNNWFLSLELGRITAAAVPSPAR